MMQIKKILLLPMILIALQVNPKNNENIIKYQKILAKNPSHFGALFELGNEFFKNDQYTEAIIHYKKALRGNPKNAIIYYRIAMTLIAQKEPFDKAIEFLNKAIEIDPSYTKAYFKRACIFEKLNKFDSAISDYWETINLNPKFFNAYRPLANLLRKQEKFDEAIQIHKKLIELKPNNTSSLFSIGYTFNMCGRSGEAIEAYKKILELQPGNIQAQYNIGYSQKMNGDVDGAIETYKHVLEIKPDYKHAVYGLALAYLYNGDFKNGWDQYALRLIEEKRNAEKLRSFLDEGTIAGKTIFLFPEGGLGDTIQFIRYAKTLNDMGAKVVVSVQKPLKPLLSHCTYMELRSPDKPLQFHDKASIMSMPAIFRTQEKDIPKNIPYIHPDPQLVEKWGKYFENNKNFKIGLCWEADVKNDVSRMPVARRSIPLVKLSHLSGFDNVEFYSLQKSDGSKQINDLPDHFTVKDFGPDFDSTPFMDTAAIMKHLDLVITVDTSIAHLAGALGVDVWVMLPYNSDWRWIVNRTDSPWYSTMSIFKQSIPFDWDGVVEKIFDSLKKHLQNKKSVD